MVKQIIFDWKRTLYNPESGILLDGAQTVLETLEEQGLDLILIGRGEGDMDVAIDKIGVRGLFKAVHFVPVKSEVLFREYISEANPQATLAIGDRAQKEVGLAKTLGAKAIWLRSGIFKDELPLPNTPPPDEIIHDIRDVLKSPLIVT